MTTLEKEFPEMHSKMLMRADAEKLMKRFMSVHRKLGGVANDRSKLALNQYLREMNSIFRDGQNLGI
jgi:hypothetical protein